MIKLECERQDSNLQVPRGETVASRATAFANFATLALRQMRLESGRRFQDASPNYFQPPVLAREYWPEPSLT